MLSIFVILAGCASTNIVRSEYTPKISSRSLTIEKDLAAKTKKPRILVLKFQDKRMGYKEKNTDALKSKDSSNYLIDFEDFKDPYFIWKGNGIQEYRLKTKTLCDYLNESLIFDLSRLGFNIVSYNKSDLSFQEIIKNNQMIPANTLYVVSIDVLMCEPDFVAGLINIDLFYYYYYRVTIYDVLKSKVVYHTELNRTVEGTPSAGHLGFGAMVDRLLNDYLFEINYDIAEILVKYK